MFTPCFARYQGLVNVPMFHITQLLGIFHLQQLFEGDGNQIPKKGTFNNPWLWTHVVYWTSSILRIPTNQFLKGWIFASFDGRWEGNVLHLDETCKGQRTSSSQTSGSRTDVHIRSVACLMTPICRTFRNTSPFEKIKKKTRNQAGPNSNKGPSKGYWFWYYTRLCLVFVLFSPGHFA